MVKEIELQSRATYPPSGQRQSVILKNSASFSSELNKSVLESSSRVGNDQKSVGPGKPILLGRTSQSQPTVSELLLANGDYTERGWNIIFSEVNSGKPYTQIPLGTPIYLDPKTSELSWPSSAAGPSLVKRSTQVLEDRAPTAASHVHNAPRESFSQNKIEQDTQATFTIGKISQQTPTVSHLLQANGSLNDEKWNILASPINADKNFTRIPTGAEVSYNPVTNELTWENQTQPIIRTELANSVENPILSQPSANMAMAKLQAMGNLPAKNITLGAPDLTEAVQPYLGRSYDEINCYNLLVKGLKKMGLPYGGRDGLRNKLTSMAREKGLPSNAYLNGEGIVKATGRKILSHSYLSVSNPTEDAGKTFEKMEQLLEKGQILSFSTPTRGHTGIISQHEDQWTFINSGRMDNTVVDATRSKEVGEENLFDEVKNWFKTAKENSESLVVTLGQLEEEKIRNTFNPDFKISRRL